MYDFKVKWCPICDSGWVEIGKNISNGKLFCGCSECENGWDHPKSVSKGTSIGLVYDIPCCEPTKEEIRENGWDKFILS